MPDEPMFDEGMSDERISMIDGPTEDEPMKWAVRDSNP